MTTDKFTDRARTVMRLAAQEAIRLNHEHIGPEHILLGLIKEGSGVGANVLKNLGIELQSLRQEVKKHFTRVGPDLVPRGRITLSAPANTVLDLAREESVNLGHHHIGTEHLLLGLLREYDSPAGQVLRPLLIGSGVPAGVVLETVRRKVFLAIGETEPDAKGFVANPDKESPAPSPLAQIGPETSPIDFRANAVECLRLAEEALRKLGPVGHEWVADPVSSDLIVYVNSLALMALANTNLDRANPR